MRLAKYALAGAIMLGAGVAGLPERANAHGVSIYTPHFSFRAGPRYKKRYYRKRHYGHRYKRGYNRRYYGKRHYHHRKYRRHHRRYWR